MDHKKALFLLGLIVTTGTGLAEQKKETLAEQKKKASEYFPETETVKKAMARDILKLKMLQCITDPGEDKDCQQLQKIFIDGQVHSNRKKIEKTLANKAKKLYEKEEVLNKSFDENEYKELLALTIIDLRSFYLQFLSCQGLMFKKLKKMNESTNSDET